MTILQFELSPDSLERLRRSVQNRIYDRIKNSSEQIKGLVREAVFAAERGVKPEGMYQVLPVLGFDENTIQTPTGKIHSPMFSRLIDQCQGDCHIMFMVVTIGSEWEETGRHKGIFGQWVFDLVGSELVETAADYLEHHWEKESDIAGRQYSERFSPGYCDWPLEGQQVIFNSLDTKKIGVTLSAHMVMTPEKSISAIKIAADKVPFSKPCRFCDKKECPWRR